MRVDKVVTKLEEKFGKGVVVPLEGKLDEDINFTSSGSIELDIALGGGFAQGRVAEVYGEESTGKTTLAIHTAVETQKIGKIAAYIDMEHVFDKFYAVTLGLDLNKDKFLFSQPDNGEQAFDIVEAFLGVDNIGVIVIDSVSALTPKAEIEGDFGDSKMGLHARLMSQGMRKLVGQVHKSNAVVFFINQMRDMIGVTFGDPKTTTGGNALKFYASQRVRLYSSGKKKDSDEKIVAVTIRAKVVKNKVAPPFQEARFDICFGTGIDKYQEILDLAVECEIVKKSGSWYSYGDTRLGQGELAVKSIFKDNPELVEELLKKVKTNCGLE